MRAALLSLALLLPEVALARPDHVLLIGVTDYAPEVSEVAQPLKGPGNDVALMLDVLLSDGVDAKNVTVLTDRPTDTAVSAMRPARQAILSALDSLVERVLPNDEVLIFLAGHGAQVSAPNAWEEPDGLDEVFLPADFVLQPDGTFSNQITDNEIGSRIDRMVAKGGHVWLVADTCHSGSLRRSDGADAVARFVDLSATGTGAAELEQLVDVLSPRASAGSFVGFYGAVAGSLAFEARSKETEKTHGLLTLSLVKALRQRRAKTYRALASEVAAGLWQTGQGRADPEFAGALARNQMLDRNSGRDTYPVRMGERLEIGAGWVDGVSPGSKIAVSLADGGVLFHTTISDADLTRAFADVPSEGVEMLDAEMRKEGLDPAAMRTRWLADRAPRLSASVVAPALDFGIGVALPLDASDDLRGVVKSLEPMVRITSERADSRLERQGSRLYLRPAPAGVGQALSVSDDPAGLIVLPRLLKRAAKTRALVSVANALRDTPVSKSLDVSIAVVSGQDSGDRRCARVNAATVRTRFEDPKPVKVRHCDEVTLRVHNQGSTAVDITPLYLAADKQVYFLKTFPGSQRGGWRISSGAEETLSYVEATRGPGGVPLATGPMHLLLLAVVAKGEGDPVDFRYLQDLDPPARQRSEGQTAMTQILNAAGFGLALTRSIGQHVLGAGGAWIVPIETVSDERLADKGD